MTITSQHEQEWLDSGIDSEIIALNLVSLSGDLAYEYLLFGLSRNDRRNDGRLRNGWLKQYEHLNDGGWWCSGYDVLTNTDAKWGCFKPDRPRSNHQGKVVKYEHPPRVPTEVFTLNVPLSIWERIAARYHLDFNQNGNFWHWVIEHYQIPILITEGAKKAGALLTAGYVAIALPGINNACSSETSTLIPHLELFCQKWREIVFAFDCDRKWKTVQAVSKAILTTGKLFQEKGCEVFVTQWRHTDGKGVDDLIKNQGVDTWHLVYERRQSLAEFEKTKKEKSTKMDVDDLLKFLTVEFEGRLAFDELKCQVTLDGRVLALTDELRCWLCEKYKIKTTKEALNDALTYQARKFSFHPVRKYLETVARTVKPININDLSARYFGTEDVLYDIFLKRWLIGAVARIMEPGCKLDTALILQGDQGVKKSTFFGTLGGTWFDDSLSDLGNKDSLLILHKCWIQELGEFEKISSKRAAGEIKAFLARRSDCFRKPYGREAQDHARMFVLCGSVNKLGFLLDETGNRRFWIIPLGDGIDKIEINLLAQERDAIWAGAVQAYRRGEQWWLTDQEQYLSSQNNERFELMDEWQPEVETYIQTHETVSVKEILERQFEILPAQQDKASQMRVATILNR
jgi:predicted P-loop ATPase